ncbi:MAG: hypothetical protein P4L00_11280 [Candidatus Acidoferrales bacterium]|nr:hypothetical protein [Candidatus Acidoferrales bacterium]
MNVLFASRPFHSLAVLVVVFFALPTSIVSARRAQQAGDSTAQAQLDELPLPDIPTLLRDIGKNQRALEDLRRLYTCHLSEEQDKTDSDGNVKSRTMKDYDVFYIGDEQVRRLLAKDGKPLAGSEKNDEDERFNKKYDELKEKQAELAGDPKKQAKKEEEDEAQLSDFLRAELFTNPRREMFRGHEVIAFDFNGNSNVKPKKRIDGIIQKLSGVMWVDEQAREIVRLEARFAEGVKIGGGLLASLQKGSNFVFEQEKINEEVWLPSYAEVHFSGRIVFVKLKQNFIDRWSDYKKFRSGAALGATTPTQQ